MRKAILMMLLAIVSNSVAAEWVLAGRNKTATIYTDPATISKAGDRVKMWVLHDFHQTAMDAYGKKPYKSSKVQAEYDCKNEQTRILYTSDLSGNMGEGDVINGDSVPSNWIPVARGSIGEDLWEFACGKM